MGYDKTDNDDGLPEDNNKKEIETDDLEGLEAETRESAVDLTTEIETDDLEGLEVETRENAVGLTQETGKSTPPIEAVPVSEPDTPAAQVEEAIRDDFQPFYEKEAKEEEKVRKISSVTIYILFAGLCLALAALVVDVLFYGTGFKLEITAAAVVCFALIGIFWKSISQESKAGMVAVTIGIVLLWPRIMFIRAGLAAPWDISADFIWPILFLISPAAILFGIWLFWPRRGWIPALLSLPVLYVALSPVLSLVENATALAEIVEGPSFMGTWPIYLRSGYLLVEIVLPLGILLLLVLQARNLFRSHQKIHFGYLFWALFLVLAALIGFDGLEARDRPVAVPFNRIAKLGLPVSATISEPAAPPSATVTATDETTAPAQPEEPSTQPAASAATDETTAPAQPEKPSTQPASAATDETTAPAQPEEPSTQPAAVTATDETTAPAQPEEPSTQPVAAKATDETTAPAQPEEPSTQPASAATDETTAPEAKTLAQEPDPGIEARNLRMAVLENKVVLTEQEIGSLKETVKSQKELITFLLNILEDRLKQEKPPPVPAEPEESQEPETPSPSNEVLKDKMVLLEQEISSLKDMIKSQEELTGSLLKTLRDRLKEEKPPPVLAEPGEQQEPETPTSSNEEESETIPSEKPDSSN